jgi:predicted GNAT family acetyltransferase
VVTADLLLSPFSPLPPVKKGFCFAIMDPSPDLTDVQHNAAAHRYEITVAGATAVADYRDEGGRRVFSHTFVPPALRGRGLAEKLVRHALSDARARNLRVVPACSYVAKFIERNPEFKLIVD